MTGRNGPDLSELRAAVTAELIAEKGIATDTAVDAAILAHLRTVTADALTAAGINPTPQRVTAVLAERGLIADPITPT